MTSAVVYSSGVVLKRWKERQVIKNIVFDMGNVLAKFDTELFCASRAKNPKDAALLRQEVFASVEWAKLDRGVITKEEAVRTIGERLPKRLHARARWLVTHWYDHFEVDQKMEKFIPRLKAKGCKLFLLSNAGFDFYDFRPRLKALAHFDGELVSADVHFLKPDKAIFETLLKKYALKAGESFFVDDMSINVEAAINLGFKGMVYRGEISALEKALAAEGVAL
jgi:putative hydrolase of the HAD superfamily